MPPARPRAACHTSRGSPARQTLPRAWLCTDASQAVKLFFGAGRDLSSRLIEWFGRGAGGWSHVAAILPSGDVIDARSDEVDGVPPGVHVRSLAAEGYRRWEIIEMPATAEQDASFYRFLRRQIGRPYDVLGILDFV